MKKFGVEIELGLKPGFRISDAGRVLAEVGLGGSSVRYNEFDMTKWVVKPDGSVPGGVEVVSPPLNFDDEAQRGQVDIAVKALQAVCKPVTAGGIHVHVESVDLTARQVAAVARTFTSFEDVIYRIASSGWETIRGNARQYARPLTDSQVQGLAKARTDRQVRQAYYGSEAVFAQGHHHHSSRYCGLNLHSHFYRGTIEFRVFNSSLNAKRIQTYIAVCVAIVQDAREGHLRSVNKAVKLGQMANGEADAAKAFFRFLGVLRYQAGMSLDDYRNLKKIWKDSKAQRAF